MSRMSIAYAFVAIVYLYHTGRIALDQAFAVVTHQIISPREAVAIDNSNNNSSNNKRNNSNNNNNSNSNNSVSVDTLQQKDAHKVPSRRKFVRYESSSWEQEWLAAIPTFHHDPELIRTPMCQKMQQDSDKVKRYMEATCNTFSKRRRGSPWCAADDSHRPIFLDRSTGFATMYNPGRKAANLGNKQPVVIQDKDSYLFSRFVYQNELTNETYLEYIEPLVGFLRHPLACCEDVYHHSTKFVPTPGPLRNGSKCWGYLHTSRTHYVPPSTITMKRVSDGGTFSDSAKYYYFDAGASQWESGAGGPSLKWFHDLYQLHLGYHNFDTMFCYEAKTSTKDFYETVPEEHQSFIQYHHTYVRSSVHDTLHPDGPFLPHVIQNVAQKDDYVLFKLDIDSPGVEEGTIDFLMDPANDILDYIDDFYYEFHLQGSNTTIMEWYRTFLTMREKGVRSHSWI